MFTCYVCLSCFPSTGNEAPKCETYVLIIIRKTSEFTIKVKIIIKQSRVHELNVGYIKSSGYDSNKVEEEMGSALIVHKSIKNKYTTAIRVATVFTAQVRDMYFRIGLANKIN